MEGACSTDKRDKICIQNYSPQSPKEIDKWGYLGVIGRIILKLHITKLGVRLWIGFS
jgi:hypothetical protein